MIGTKLKIDGGKSAVDGTRRAFKPRTRLASARCKRHTAKDRVIGLAPAIAVSACLSLITVPAQGDVVTDWNEIADNASNSALPPGPPPKARVLAMTQIAVHDALNSIDARHASYTGVPRAKPGASPDAAVATASYVVLAQTVPSQASALSLVYANKISELPDCPAVYPDCIEDGIETGETAAGAIIAKRNGDGSTTPHLPYNLPPGPGVYQRTPTALLDPQWAGWAHVTPFALNSGSQFRSDPSEIFDLTSEAYTRDYNEVKRVGAASAEAIGNRTPDQSAIARFWPGGGTNWNAVTRVIVAGRGLDPWEHARLFALLNMASSDGFVSVFDTKYTYNFWRPVTAIRAGNTDGNPATDGDPTWLPLLQTPPYPDYTCGLTTNAGTAVEVLRRYFGTDDIAYTFTAAGSTRSYGSLSQAAAEAVDARVFAGIHFRTGCAQGVRQGEHVGRFVIQHFLKPVKTKGNG
jgi:hypothetical protein